MPKEEIDKTAAESKIDTSRRSFMKLGVAGAGLAAATLGGVSVVKRMSGIPLDEFPLQLNEDFKPIDQRNQINVFTKSKRLNEKYPERNRAFSMQLKEETSQPNASFHFYEDGLNFMSGPYRDTAGFSQLEQALAHGGFSSARQQLGGGGMEGPKHPHSVSHWRQDLVTDQKYEFASPQDANLKIKSAARLFGAARCGITRRDKRWDYDPMFDPHTDKVLTWENDFPFVPKTVIVILVEMDYHAIAAAPGWLTDATVGDAYANAIKIAGQMSVFLQRLGYQAVASMNDVGVNAPYAISAGLAEEARNGQVITPHYGPRVRISKVYTDFEFVEYDKPRDFGVGRFCKHCKRCADACPSKAITHGEPTWEPEYSSDPHNTWNASHGILKYHNDSKKCYKFWIDNDGSCSNCICSCPYNKPDFWHHRLVDAQNVISPGPVHSFMREMDRIFGYGAVSDPARVDKFWKLGKKV